MKLIFDSEGDGLLQECSRIWCIACKDIDDDFHEVYTPHTLHSITDHTSILDRADTLIGHNIIGYDLPILKRILGWEPKKGVQIVDTLIISRLLNPDRTGGHSLEAWGYKLGRHKVEHEDWTQYSGEMLHRCVEDVEITHKVYNILLREMKK